METQAYCRMCVFWSGKSKQPFYKQHTSNDMDENILDDKEFKEKYKTHRDILN